MLIFTYKLETYIRKNLFSKILLVPNKYVIKGSFRRRIPYVTDIDVINEVYPTINKSNIYDEILKLINKLSSKENSNIILVYVTCGVDERFDIKTGSDEELDQMKKLLPKDDLTQFESVREKYSDNFNKKIFYISELIWKYYKLRWTPKNILENKMILLGGLEIKFTDTLQKNLSLLLQYYVKIESYPVGIDVVVNYEPVDLSNAYQSAASYQLKLANYSKEYYYMLFPFKHFFKNDPKLAKELEDLIETKFGLYKQLMVRIDTYHTLYETNNLDIRTASLMAAGIVKDTEQLPDFSSNITDKIRRVATDNSPDVKMKEWDVLLDVLYDEINISANMAAKEYFFKYLGLIPENIRDKYYFNVRPLPKN